MFRLFYVLVYFFFPPSLNGLPHTSPLSPSLLERSPNLAPTPLLTGQLNFHTEASSVIFHLSFLPRFPQSYGSVLTVLIGKVALAAMVKIGILNSKKREGDGRQIAEPRNDCRLAKLNIPASIPQLPPVLFAYFFPRGVRFFTR